MEELPIEPRGLFWQDDFITREHEQQLLRIFRHELEWPEKKGASPARLSLHYGYTFDYKTFGVDPDIPYKPFPAWLEPLVPRAAAEEGAEGEGEGASSRPPDQVCLQWYPPGAGIPPHVDTHSAYDQLCALSLGAPVVMQFRKQGGSGGEKGGKEEEEEEEEDRRVDVDLTPRSMLRMAGDARLHWTHGIKKRRTDTLPDGTVRLREDRWSITYRWLRTPDEDGSGKRECECGDVRLCDTAQRRCGIEREYRWKTAADGGKDASSSAAVVVDEALSGDSNNDKNG